MKIVIDGKTYTAMVNLRFRPQIDLTGDTLPVNEFSADIRTKDSIGAGQYAELYDDTDRLWAKYWLKRAFRVDGATVRVQAQSPVALMDHVDLGPELYEDAPAADVMDDIFHALGANGQTVGFGPYSLDESLQSVPVSGFCPLETARQRLQRVCYVIGAYVRTFFNDAIEILPVPEGDDPMAAELIPMSSIYWRPQIDLKDTVTAIRLTAYAFSLPDPETGVQAGDRYVSGDGDDRYLYTESEMSLANPEGAGLPVNEVSVSRLYLINEDCGDEVLTRLARNYFNPIQVDLEVIDNGEYLPGQLVNFYVSPETIYSGYIASCDFTFGLQARASMRIACAALTPSGALIIRYRWEDNLVGEKTYTFPVGYAYSVKNPYIDYTLGIHRYIFRPLKDYAEGVITAARTVDIEDVTPALDLCLGILTVISVDGLSDRSVEAEEAVIMIGVIA